MLQKVAEHQRSMFMVRGYQWTGFLITGCCENSKLSFDFFLDFLNMRNFPPKENRVPPRQKFRIHAEHHFDINHHRGRTHNTSNCCLRCALLDWSIANLSKHLWRWKLQLLLLCNPENSDLLPKMTLKFQPHAKVGHRSFHGFGSRELKTKWTHKDVWLIFEVKKMFHGYLDLLFYLTRQSKPPSSW